MKMLKRVIATEEISDLQRLFSIAIKAANSQTVDGVERCVDILRYLKNLSFSAKDLDRVSKEIAPLASLRDHRNPKIRMGAKALFNSWMRTFYSGGGRRDLSTCNSKKLLNKPADPVVKVFPDLKKRNVKRFVTTREKKTVDRKSCAAKKPVEEKKRSAVTMKFSENHKSMAHESVETKQQNFVPAVKRNSTKTLELFEIAKKSADVASAKGILLSTEETSICVDALSFLIEFPISSIAPETKRIMEKLTYLTKHKDRKICNSATALLQQWRQSITDQQHKDALNQPKKAAIKNDVRDQDMDMKLQMSSSGVLTSFPRAQFLPEVGIFALPYTVMF